MDEAAMKMMQMKGLMMAICNDDHEEKRGRSKDQDDDDDDDDDDDASSSPSPPILLSSSPPRLLASSPSPTSTSLRNKRQETAFLVQFAVKKPHPVYFGVWALQDLEEMNKAKMPKQMTPLEQDK
eukprot:2048536-Rhodomonas_salina.1